MQPESKMQPIEGIDVPYRIYTDREAFRDAVREGVPGEVVRQSAEVLGIRDLLLALFDVSSGNLSRLYRKERLGKAQTEAVLQVVRLFSLAVTALGDTEKAQEWMNSPIPILGMEKPIDLCDTSEGREIVNEMLFSIYYGDFS